MSLQSREQCVAAAPSIGVPPGEIFFRPKYVEPEAVDVAMRCMEGWISEFRVGMAVRYCFYAGPLIPDGARHQFDAEPWGRKSNCWYMIQLELGPVGFFGWTDHQGEKFYRWSAGKRSQRVKPPRIPLVLERFDRRCERLAQVKSDWAAMVELSADLCERNPHGSERG